MKRQRLQDVKILTRACIPKVVREASTPLPEPAIARAEEGERRLEVVSRELAEQARDRVHCDPARAMALAFEIAQAVYSLLQALGRIGPDGKTHG